MNESIRVNDFQSATGHNIYARAYFPETEVKAVLIIVHGLCEHSGRYAPFIEYFLLQGYAIYALDHEGHGRSEGVRGDIRLFDLYVDTLEMFINSVKEQNSNKCLFLVGHSMGGVISLTYLLRNQTLVSGCILSGAALVSDEAVPRIAKIVVKILAKILPRMHFLKLEGADVSRDPSVVKAYEEDSLVYRGKATARLLDNIFKAADAAIKNAAKVKLPILIMHGEADLLAEARGSKVLYDTVGSNDKELKLYPELFHEIFLEPERDQVFSDVSGWLASRISA